MHRRLRPSTAARHLLVFAAATYAVVAAAAAPAAGLTSLNLGDEASETAHNVKTKNAAVVETAVPAGENGGETLTVPGRRIAPGEDGGKGWIAFDADVSPDEQNYITLRLWGGDKNWGALHLLKEDGKMELGNIWWWGTRNNPFPGRWIYRTYRIPRPVTDGQDELRLRLRAPGKRFAIYNLHVHTEPFFEIPEDHRGGRAFEWGAPREKPDDYPSIEKRLKQRARQEIERVMNFNVTRSGFHPGAHRHPTRALYALAVVYHTEWSDHYRDEKILNKAREAIDVHVKRLAGYGWDAGNMFYRGWISFGNIARAYNLLHEQFEERGWLEESITLEGPEGTYSMPRREAYADFFHNAFEWRRGDRRHYTNQPVHVSWTMYNTQAALRRLGDERALTKAESLWYVREAMGLVPLRSRRYGIQADAANFPYYVITRDGLSRELGYVDGYGELSGSLARLARVTGSEEVKKRAIEFLRTRSYFRMPANDSGGHRVLRGIGFMGWRGKSYPTNIRYSGIREAAILESPTALRLAQLQVQHGRPYRLGEDIGGRGAHWHPVSNIRAYDNYRKVKGMPATDHRIPMEPEHGDFVFGDEGAGVYVFRHGETRIYGSFYFGRPTGGRAIDDLGVLRCWQPEAERIVDLHFDAFAPSSDMFIEIERPWGTERYEQPPTPPGIDEWPTKPPHNIDRRAGLAYFYRLRYGDYLIGMNTTPEGSYRESTYTLEIPEDVSRATNVATGESVDVNESVDVGPQSTTVLYLEE